MRYRAIIGKTKVEIKFNSKMIICYKIRKRLSCCCYEGKLTCTYPLYLPGNGLVLRNISNLKRLFL